MSGFRVVLDACVLVPIIKADLLLTLAQRGAFQPLWSERILDEMARAIVKVSEGRVSDDRVKERVSVMNASFEDAEVVSWEPLETSIVGLPDPDDRHVVATAVRGNAAAIVTDNIKDFPAGVLEPWGLHAVPSDEFFLDLLDLNKGRTVSCLIEMSERRRNPPCTFEEVLVQLERAGAQLFVREVHETLDE